MCVFNQGRMEQVVAQGLLCISVSTVNAGDIRGDDKQWKKNMDAG